MTWLVAALLGVAARAGDPAALVTRFLDLMDRDPVAAAALLDPEAMMGVGDIGGPLTVETLAVIRSAGCVHQGRSAVDEELTASLDGEAAAVVTDWLCSPGEGQPARPLTISFIVGEQRIAGAYLEFADVEVSRTDNNESVADGPAREERDASTPFPQVSDEVVQLTPATRARLEALRAEAKFAPHDFPPLGYVGPDTPEDAPVLNATVNDFIDSVLAEADGPISAHSVSAKMQPSLDRLDPLATEDRERAAGYLIEVWYVLGFEEPTGHFAHGSGYPVPEGYGEPLPPGWTAPDRPRLPATQVR
ncbi:hypothetical protein [Brevundimonas sp.]|uniref:hypothetical protein n=1 Tax=Brevundimonas sp. TaxID=1871086 RepID=UPI002D583709|nr:hypothetical protein [Brevundimonas sp.]HYC74857.1 hypothetical protein [Brevundimonas sp.]